MLKDLKGYLLIRHSGYFDAQYYLSRYPDVRRSDVDPLFHYLRHGWKEGRYPSSEWETRLTSGNYQLDPTSQDNPLIEYIKRTKDEKRALRPDLPKLFRLFHLFLFSFWIKKGIVFFGGYPYPERIKDGYYQRIQLIDSFFKDRWRIYIDSVRLPGRDFWYDIPAACTLVIRPHGIGIQPGFIKSFAMFCIIHSLVVYFHSVLSVGGNTEFLWSNKKINKIIDIHGAVPEEFKYQGDDNNSQLFERIEKMAVTQANHIIVVTEAMRDHLLNKYPGQIPGKFITLPNIQEIPIEHLDKPYGNNKPVIIYAGGVQVWQQIPKIIDAISRTYHLYWYKFYCPNPDEVMALLPEDIVGQHGLELESKQREELFQEYRLSHYGFILRENRIVNNVACPTKLVEYLAMGIIPIVDCPEIGDFKAFGMQYIGLDDLLSNSLPTEQIRQKMAGHNYSIYDKILNQYKSGVINLQRSIDHRG